ncbi:MAG TPA: glycosyltransferase family 4 protein [Kofleriaceae bacterium]|jgi:glycosyltransferase involved in cell wall biosynthesis
MSILVVSNFLSSKGHNRAYSEDLADRLDARGQPVIRTSSEIGRVRRLVDMLTTAFRRRRDYGFALIDVFSGPAFVWAEAVAFELRRLNKPYVLTLHGGQLPAFAQRWPARVRRLLQSATAVTAPSGFLAESMRAYRNDTRVIANALEIGDYVFSPRTRVEPRMVWVRAMHEIYNPVLAVDVLARVAAKHPTAHLVMVGPDKDGTLRSVEQRAEALGVRDRLELAGAVPRTNIPSYLADADIFLNTTNVDNTPLSILEAMASGLCIVSTNVGGVPHLLADRETALLVPPRSPVAMANAVDSILSDQALAARLSTQARVAANERRWERVLDQWDRVFEEVAPRA